MSWNPVFPLNSQCKALAQNRTKDIILKLDKPYKSFTINSVWYLSLGGSPGDYFIWLTANNGDAVYCRINTSSQTD